MHLYKLFGVGFAPIIAKIYKFKQNSLQFHKKARSENGG
ncbi:hypothetical protein HMPREF1139_1033 [Campylobacter sp. FOBRC14]|nr:hypothetical protein HMPREF1139_1033 [Campylobacter sp. FOBRC14]